MILLWLDKDVMTSCLIIIDRLVEKWKLPTGVMLSAVITKQPYYNTWSVRGNNGLVTWYNDISSLNARILQRMHSIVHHYGQGRVLADVTDFPLIQCTFEQCGTIVPQTTVPFALMQVRHYSVR